MKLRFKFLFISILMIVLGGPVFAQVKRSVDLELEVVEGATAYEIELYSTRTKKKTTFKMKEPRWQANIRNGNYTMRLRSYDTRGVPGPWSESSDFAILLPGPQLQSPIADTVIKTDENNEFKIELKWTAITGAEKYELVIIPDVGEKIIEIVDENKIKTKLPVAKSYTWTARAYVGEEKGEPSKSETFTLIGKKISKPEVEKPTDIFVDVVKWEKPDFADKYKYALSHKTDDGKWAVMDAKAETANTSVMIPVEFPGGRYKLSVKAFGQKREDSSTSSIEFDVYVGNRAPAAIEDAKLRASLDYPKSYYFIASLLLTFINYESTYNTSAGDTQLGTRFDGAWSGTGRLGVGYISPKSNIGLVGILDYSGVDVDVDESAKESIETQNYGSFEGHAIWRYTWGRNMLRASSGIFYRELPFMEQKNGLSTEISVENISYYGAHVGFDFWRPFTSRLGAQLNARYYMGLGASQMPENSDGGDINASMLQVGLLGSYKIYTDVIGFFGLVYKSENVSFAPKSNAVSGDEQTISSEGPFVNMHLEWGF
jgi:hypothetical protein